jgi:hypothetical protein
MALSKQLEAAIRNLVECWLDDGNVQHLHSAWLVLAKHVGREKDAREVIGYRQSEVED